MALISKTIANLINGVSQQPPTIRNPTQCEAQENLLSDVTHGVVQRPPAEFVKNLWSGLNINYRPFIHTISQNSSSRFKVVITNGDLKVFDLDGVEKTVSFPDGKAYLTSTNPQEDFQCLTLGDKTYILNRTVTTATEAAASSSIYGISEVADIERQKNAFIFVKQGDYSTDYNVLLRGNQYNTLTDTEVTVYGPTLVTKTTSASAANDIKTSQIASDLATGITAANGAFAASVFQTSGILGTGSSVIWLVGRTNPGTTWERFNIQVSDSKGNNNIRYCEGAVQKFTDLPTECIEGFRVRVIGDKASGFDDYYVVFRCDQPQASGGSGSWEESFWYGTHYQPDPTTMPLALIDNGDGTFTCQEESWDAREAGDETLNPDPSFIGSPIQYMFTYGNRLGFLSGARVVLSEVGVFTNFYLTTVTTFIDSDPIDIQPLQAQDDWLYAVPLAEKLVLFSAKGQAVITGGELRTPKNASLKATTAYPVSSRCEPIVLGNNLMFCADSGDYSRVYEYFVQQDVDTLKAAEITSHCPRYLPKGILRLSGDDASNMLVATGTGIPGVSPAHSFYVYKYFWVGDQKVQSSWSRWSLPKGTSDQPWYILDGHVLDGLLYLTVFNENSGAGQVLLLKIDLDFTKKDSNSRIKTALDLRVSGAVISSSLSGTTRTFTLPFQVPAGLQSSMKAYRFEDSTGSPRVPYGEEVELTWLSTTQVSIEDPTGEILANVWLGFPYESLFTFSQIHLKEDSNGSLVPVEAGNLTIKRLDVLYSESFYFRAEVTPTDKATKTFTMSPYILGSSTPLEDVTGRTDKFSFPVGARNDKVTISIINDTVAPHRLQSAEWTGTYTILSRRV